MRITQLFISLLLASSLSAISVHAAETTAEVKETIKLESISTAPASAAGMKDCPMHHDKKECDHKKGEPCPMHKGEKKCDHKKGVQCPHHKNDKHHDASHEKCDHKHPD